MWFMGEIPQELGWTVLVLIPKGATYTIGIVLLDTLWKVVEALVDTRLRASLQMHDILHMFRARRGMRTAIIELFFPQELASIDQDTLCLVYLDLRKAYDTVDRDRLLITLEGYGAGPCLCGILETFRYWQRVVPKQNGFHGPVFHVTRGTTQGRLASLTLFKMVVDNIIRI